MATKLGSLITRELEDVFIPVLRNCISMAGLKKIHAQIIKFSLSQSNFLVTKMVDVCDDNGDIDYANLLFKEMVEPNIYLYNAMIRTYTHNHVYIVAITFYKEMLRYPQAENPVFPDKFTFPFVVKSCSALLRQDLGKQVHGHICKFGPKSNNVTENALIDMYAKFDNLKDAHIVFEDMTDRDAISWNNLISGHARLGQLRRAKSIFDEMPNKTIVSWTSMISGYARIGCYADALGVFRQMQKVGIKPDEISIVAVLPACAHTGALELGKWIHIYADKNRFLQKTYICNALIEMYAKCGSINQAFQVFDQMSQRDVISWSTMIGGLASHGKASEAVELFREMQKAKVEPNAITFLGLLSACAHAGFLNEGLNYFDSMSKDYHIEPEVEHYGCLVDLLGRSGCLDRAFDLVKMMPMKPDAAIWGSLLSSCRAHCNLEFANTAMEHLLELEPDDTGNYVLLSNIYADLGKWEGVSKMRKLIRSKSMKKMPGCSSIEVDSKVEEFLSWDDSKPFLQDINWILELLALHQSKTVDAIETFPEDRSQFLS
ncbi:pentatricopeptide repeat-containing protein At2g20540 [Malania oleifera]|uniref:pentatricopeptide repeat-containing protein At2g20540 n=1 Tax=Malania oleifera TaxID=397392 RepID=UPI0025ADB767|nr:pentatricopeptide repeat-containing protein At2g20540 [Malania oleifera]